MRVRAAGLQGFYETWGCLVWVPCMYTNHMHCAVRTPSGLSPLVSSTIGIFGLICIALNYWSDRQRQVLCHVKTDFLILSLLSNCVEDAFSLTKRLLSSGLHSYVSVVFFLDTVHVGFE